MCHRGTVGFMVMKKRKKSGAPPDWSNRKIVKIILDEIADVRRELKEDIHALDEKVGKLDTKVNQLDTKVNQLAAEMRHMRSDFHRNQVSFIENQTDMDKRVCVLEVKVG